MSLLDRLAGYVDELSFQALPGEVAAKAELHTFDALGAMLAGIDSEEALAMRRLTDRMHSGGGRNTLPMPGFGVSLPLPQAVMNACTTSRMTECDDIHLPSCTTPGSIVVPTALLCAIHSGASGAGFYEGVIVGYDVMSRLGRSVNGPIIVYRGLWPTYLCGAVTAAAIAGKVMGLNRDRIRHALAIALTITTGLSGKIMTGLTSRWMTLGCALQNGVLSALAAEDGFAGDPDILDGAFQNIYGLELDQNRLLDGLGQSFNVSAMSLKPHCTARQALSATLALAEVIAAEGVDPNDIQHVRVFVPDQYKDMINRPAFPEARVPSIVSIQYQMALAAFYYEDLYDLNRNNLRDDDRVRNFINHVTVAGDENYTRLYPNKWPGRVEVEAAGKTYVHEVISPKGDPDNPMTWVEVEQKVKKLAAHALPPDRIEKLGNAVKGLKSADHLGYFSEQVPVVNLT